MFATLDGFRVKWPMGEENILLVSLGTGSRDPSVKKKFFEGQNAIKSLVFMMDDCNDLVQTMLQWMSSSPTAKRIDSEIGDLRNDLLAGEPRLSYLRYNMELSGKALSKELDMNLDAKTLKRLAKMDVPDNMPLLKEIGTATAEKLISEEHFPEGFDLDSTAAANQVAGAAVLAGLFSFAFWDRQR